MQMFSPLWLFIPIVALISCNHHPEEKKQPSALAASDTGRIAYLQQQLITTPAADSLREKLFLVLLQSGAIQKAITHTDTLLQHQPDNPAYHYMKADAAERYGDTGLAIRHYRLAIEKAGIFPEASLKLANLLAEKGQPEALVICEALLELPAATKLRSHILFTKGIYYVKVGQSSKALQTFDQLIREDYVYMDAYIEKGLIYYDMGKFAEAHKVFTLATEVSNAYADGYFWMAKCEEKMGRKADAVANYKRCLALDPTIQEARQALQQLESN